MLFRSGLGVGHCATHGAGVVTSRVSEEGAGRLSGCVLPSGGGVERSSSFVSKLQTPTQPVLSRAGKLHYRYAQSKRNLLAQI